MTKADIVNKIAKNTGLEKTEVQSVVEGFMECVIESLSKDEPVFLRGFGSFIIKHRAEKTARDILNWRRRVGKLGEIRLELQELLLPHIVVAVTYCRLVKVVIVMVGLLYEGPQFLDPRLCVCLVH